MKSLEHRISVVLFMVVMTTYIISCSKQGSQESRIREYKQKKAELDQLVPSSDFKKECKRIEDLGIDGLIEILNKPVAGPLKDTYPDCLGNEYRQGYETVAFTPENWAWLSEYIAEERLNEPLIHLTTREWYDALKKDMAFGWLAKKDEKKALSWLRASMRMPPALMDAIYASAFWRETISRHKQEWDNRKPDWSPLLRENNLFLFSIAQSCASDFASDEELLAAFERATSTEWPTLHGTAIENLRTRRPPGTVAALEKYLQRLGDAPFSTERRASLRRDATRLLEELKTPK